MKEPNMLEVKTGIILIPNLLWDERKMGVVINKVKIKLVVPPRFVMCLLMHVNTLSL